MRILSVGGGPAGLYFALLAKQADPSREITVVERNGPKDTFGFGVVFSERTLEELRGHDADTFDGIAAALVRWDTIHVRHRGRSLRSAGHGFSAIARMRLLSILQERARDVGVDLRFRTDFDAPEVFADYDLVLGADGVNSRIRAGRAACFQPSVHVGTAKFIWFGTTKVYDSFYFAFEAGEHGAFASHAYPYDDGRSTFIVETSEAAWRAAGLDQHADEAAAPGSSDLHSRDYCEKLFADHLSGHELLVNNSKWQSFPTLRNARWSDGNVVLVGDAAHTAHFSVGSGTKMAMEDAAALALALDQEGDIPSALVAYERTRRPDVERIQDAAGPSLGWWEHFGEYMAAEPEPFTFHFLTRNPRITHAVMQRDAALVEQVERWFGDGGEPGLVPFTLNGVVFSSRRVDPESLPEAIAVARLDADLPEEEVLRRAADLAAEGCDLVILERKDREAWRVRELGKRVRLATGLAVLLVGATDNDDEVNTAVLSGRADLCAVSQP